MTVNLKTLYRSHRKKTWCVAAVFIYAFLGFVVAPLVVKNVAVNTVSEKFNSTLSLEKVRINPFTLSFRINGLDLLDEQQQPLFSLDEIYVNFQSSSIFNRAWTFREFTLTGPELTVDRYDDGSFNFDYLIELAASGEEEPVDQNQADTSLPGLLVHQFAITNAVFNWKDEVPVSEVEHRFGPIHLEFAGLSTLPDKEAEHELVITTETQGTLRWNGNVSLNPLASSGHISVSNSDFPLISRYVRDDTGINVTDGHVSIELDYTFAGPVSESGQEDLQASVENLNVTFTGIAAEVYSPATADPQDSNREFVQIPSLALRQGSLLWPQREINISDIQLDGAEISLLRDSDGVINLLKIPPLSDSGESQDVASGAGEISETADSDAQWNIALEAFTVSGLSAEMSDQSVNPQTRIGLSNLDFSLLNITNQPGDEFSASLSTGFLHEGQLALSGNVSVLPEPSFDLALDITELGLDVLEPYIQPFARLGVEGAFSLEARLQKQVEELFSFAGSVTVADFMLSENVQNSRLSSWDNLQVENIAYSLTGNSLEVSRVILDGLYGDIVIDENGQLNAAQVSQTSEPDQISAEAETETETESGGADDSDAVPMSITVGQVDIVNSTADFADYSLPLPFSANINDLNGSISTISSLSEQPSDITLEGAVDEFGLFTVEGSLTPFDINRNTSMTLDFENVDIPKFSAYMIPFAGRVIDSGRLDLNMGYSVVENQLDSVNSLLLRDFALGERVEHEGAMSLPLDLAVALLKNPQGHIDLELPVSGDVNDPEFSYGAVVGQVLSNLIVRIAASPFNLLASLVGFEGEELDSIAFAPGSAAMTPPQREKAVKLAEAMSLRPSIVLDVAGIADPEVDANALRAAQFEQLVSDRMELLSAASEEEIMLATLRRDALEALYTEQRSAADLPDLQTLRAMFVTAVDEVQAESDVGDTADTAASEQFDELAYVDELEARMLALQTLPDGTLENLAAARATSLSEAMLAESQLEAGRINLLDVVVENAAEEGRVYMEVDMGTPRR